MQLWCQNTHTLFLVAKDVCFWLAFVGFLRKSNPSSKFNCLSDNISTSSWFSWFRFISWKYDVSCVESLLFHFVVFVVILVGALFWVPAFSGVVNSLLRAFAGADDSSEGLVVRSDKGKVLGISSCWNVSLGFWKTNMIGFSSHTVIQNKNEAAVWFFGQEFHWWTKKINILTKSIEKCLQGWL